MPEIRHARGGAGSGPHPSSRRLVASLLASMALHAVGIGTAIRLARESAVPLAPRRTLITIPVSLVRRPGGGGGDAGEPPAPPTTPPTTTPPAPVAPSPPPPRPRAPAPAPKKPVPSRVPAAPTRPTTEPAVRAAPVPPGNGPARAADDGGRSSRGGTGGDGSGGDGTGGARPAYGANPLPPYPLIARRLGIEGRVLLEVTVRSDGRPATVRVQTSSGNALLDRAAVDTVTKKWRFVPARAGGVAVASTVTVPIRFRLDRN